MGVLFDRSSKFAQLTDDCGVLLPYFLDLRDSTLCILLGRVCLRELFLLTTTAPAASIPGAYGPSPLHPRASFGCATRIQNRPEGPTVGPPKRRSVNCEVPSTMNKTWAPADVFTNRKIDITFYMDSTKLTAKITKSDPTRTIAGSVTGLSLMRVRTKPEAKRILTGTTNYFW